MCYGSWLILFKKTVKKEFVQIYYVLMLINSICLNLGIHLDVVAALEMV